MIDPDMQRLLDENAIRRVTAFYGEAVAQRDAARAAALFADDAGVMVAGRETIGRAAIEEGMRRTFAAFRLLRLIAHDDVIDVAGDRASARWSTTEQAIRRDSDQLDILFGHYEDRLVRLPAGWRFAWRTFTLAGRMRLPAAKLQLEPHRPAPPDGEKNEPDR